MLCSRLNLAVTCARGWSVDRFETLASGYGLTEAPCLDAMRRLCFCDVMAGGVYRIADDGGVQTMIPERTGVGGLVLHQWRPRGQRQ
jgi:hypothetical protein